MTSQEPTNPHSADRDIRDTEVIVVSSPAPVFVDSTGRRRRLLRWLSYAFGGLCMIYGGLVSVSLAGGPVSSNAVLPLPDLRDDADQGASGPQPAPIPAPSDSARPPELFLPPRRAAAVDFTRVAEPRPPAVVAPSPPPPPKTPASTPPTSTKPVESTTVPTTSVPTTPVPSTTTPVTDPPIKTPPPPVPPAPPAPPGGGTGGGGQIPGDDADETVAAPAPPARSDAELAEPAPEVEATTDSKPEPSETAEGTAAQP